MTKTDTPPFDSFAWHDCHIWGINLRPGDPVEQEWASDLEIDIDFIADWVCGSDGAAQFSVAPATLSFHGVTDLRIAMDWGDTGGQVALQAASIDRIEREPVPHQKVFLDQPYYRFRLCLNAPKAGEITFCGVGFTQQLRAEPVRSDRQHLSARERS
jgi:hypothetical protein